MTNPQNPEYTPMCNNENCWIRVDWEPPPRDTWMSCLLGYRVGFRKTGSGPLIWMNDEGTHRDLRSDKLFFFEEAEGTNHSLTIRNLEHQTEYVVTIEVFNPYGDPIDISQIFHVETPPEPCSEASVPEPDKLVESSKNSLSVHLASWQDAQGCPTIFFMVEQRERGQEEWSSVSRSAKPGANILISNLSPATWYQIKVTGERSTGEPRKTSELRFDGNGYMKLKPEDYSLENEQDNIIEFEFRTTHPEGLMFLTGSPDIGYLAIQLRDSRIVFSFKLGSTGNVVEIQSDPVELDTWV